MSSLPHITMTGGLVDLPELRFTPSGKAVANFRLASKKRVKDGSGQWTDGDPIYLNCAVWGNLAENVAETFTRKGQRVTVEGNLAQQWWEKDGEKQSKYVIEVFSVAADLTFTAYDERPDVKSGSAKSDGGDPWSAPAQSEEPPW